MYFSVPFFFLFCSSILFSVLSKWNVPFYLLFNLRYSIPSLRENKIKMKSPFHLFHFNIPLNSILFKRYIWRIIVFFLFPRTFPTIFPQSSTNIITKLLPSFLLRSSYPPHFSCPFDFDFSTQDKERLKVQSGEALVINDPVLEWRTRIFLSTYSFEMFALRFRYRGRGSSHGKIRRVRRISCY